MSRSVFGWQYPPGCSGPPEDRTTWRVCKCGASEEDHDIDESDNLLGCAKTKCEKFEEAERPDEPLIDFDLECKDEEP